MAKRIAFFNHKGGVSKTTTTFNLGWMLATKGKTVILVDADPQCNLTGFVLDESQFQEFYEGDNDNLKKCLAPAFEGEPVHIAAANCHQVSTSQMSASQRSLFSTVPSEKLELFLLAGHLDLSEYEVTLGMAQELSAASSLQTLKNLPGSFSYLFEETAKKYQADYVLIDMNPSLSSINQNLLMTSDYFILPTSPDFFSQMAIHSLANILPRWASWADRASKIPILTQATYPFSAPKPKFLGMIIQKYRLSGRGDNSPSAGFERWIDAIKKSVNEKLIPKLRESGMLLDITNYNKLLWQFSDFNTLIALSQSCNVPVFALTAKHLEDHGYTGQVQTDMLGRALRFKEVFSEIADKIIQLTESHP